MADIIDVEPSEARDWLKSHSDWEFHGQVNTISHEKIAAFIESLYDVGCEKVFITDYEWEMEPVYEGDEFHPNMLILRLPVSKQKRDVIFKLLNTSFPDLEAKILYKDKDKESLWYFFEPEPQKITVGGKQITWYS